MTSDTHDIAVFLSTLHPYDTLLPSKQHEIAIQIERREVPAGAEIYAIGDRLPGLFIVVSGEVEISGRGGAVLSHLRTGNSFGERGLMRDGLAVTGARALEPTILDMLPEAEFKRLLEAEPSFARFFRRGPPMTADRRPLDTVRVADIMSRNVVSCAPDATVAEAAQRMRDKRISCILVTSDHRVTGILTTRDLTDRVLAAGISPETPVREVMTPDPITLGPDQLGADVLMLMLERRIGHLPVVQRGRPVGMLTQTDLTRYSALSSVGLMQQISSAETVDAIAAVVGRIPDLLAQLVGAGRRHDTVTRLVTDIADAATRRLVALAEAQLGPAPVPYLWLACGSQGRQEQTGVSDQDNCLFIADEMTDADTAYFEALARFVSDGLDTCGYVHCPGDMMATNPRWRQPVRVWRGYFAGWVRKPDPMAQMLASVMFDLRPIAGEERLFRDVQAETLELASVNSIFVAHMVANSLKHTPPLGLFRGLATIRSGEHKDALDLKLNGVVPVVDLGRIYALQGRLVPVNTRVRLEAAAEAGVISASGGRDLLDAYDVIAATRLGHQAALVRAGRKPDNFMAPGTMSDLERSHLRDAFVAVKTMQSALAQGRTSVL